jgi:short-subunit dehydrogenase
MEKMYAINVFGMARCTRVFYPLLRSSDNINSSCVINIASVCGLISFPFFSHYSPTKMAVISYSDSLRRELMHEGRVRVTCICPGFTNTPIITSCGDKGLETSKFQKEILTLQREHLDMLWSPTKMQQPPVVAGVIVDAIFSTNNPPKIIVDHFRNRINWFLLRILEPFMYDQMAAFAYKRHIKT